MFDRVPGVTDLELISSTDGVETFRGTDADTGDAVTVKVLGYEVSADQFDRFASVCRSVRAAGRHPNVARLYDAGTTADGHPYLVTELARWTLGDNVDTEGRMRWQEVVTLGADLASALDTVHRSNVIHGDVRPGTVLLAGDDVPRLTEFGWRALQTAPDTTGVSGALSSAERLAHAAPEVVQGRPASVQIGRAHV